MAMIGDVFTLVVTVVSMAMFALQIVGNVHLLKESGSSDRIIAICLLAFGCICLVVTIAWFVKYCRVVFVGRTVQLDA